MNNYFGLETDFAIFEHKQSHVFVRSNELYKEIERDTDRVAGTNTDLPESNHLSITQSGFNFHWWMGITKVPVGDQPKDIEASFIILNIFLIFNLNQKSTNDN